jgi:hypothetical protein
MLKIKVNYMEIKESGQFLVNNNNKVSDWSQTVGQ